MGELGMNVQAENATALATDIPALATVHDDLPAPYAPLGAFVGKRVEIVRTISPRSGWALGGGVPKGKVWQGINEFDNSNDPWWGDAGWARGWFPQFKAANPDVRVAYGGPDVARYTEGDLVVFNLCDVFIVHIGINADGSYFPTPSDMRAAGWPLGQLPIIIGEAEIDPNHPEALPQLVPGTIRACKDYGAEYGFLWGMSMSEANAVLGINDIDFQAQVRAFNQQQAQGGTTVAVDANDPVIVDLKKQIADFTEGMRRIVEGKYNGAEGAAAIVVALEGGTDDTIQPQPDYSPKA